MINRFSQHGEELVLGEIIGRLGLATGVFVELGAGDGVGLSNTRFLVDRGWSGVMIEGAESAFRRLVGNVRGTKVIPVMAMVSCEPGNCLDDILDRHIGDMDVLSLDVDGIDYWILKSLRRRPQIMVVEYNPSFGRESVSVPYDAGFRWSGSNFYGASVGAMVGLAGRMGYKLVGNRGVNLIFVLRGVDFPEMEAGKVWVGRHAFVADWRRPVEV